MSRSTGCSKNIWNIGKLGWNRIQYQDVSFGGKGAKLRKVNLSHAPGEDTASKVIESIVDPGGLSHHSVFSIYKNVGVVFYPVQHSSRSSILWNMLVKNRTYPTSHWGRNLFKGAGRLCLSPRPNNKPFRRHFLSHLLPVKGRVHKRAARRVGRDQVQGLTIHLIPTL